MSALRQAYLVDEIHVLQLPSHSGPAPEHRPELDSQAAENARHEAERLREHGFREGLEAGRAQGEAETQEGIETLATLLEDIVRQRQRMLHELDGEVVRLALDVARCWR